MQGRGFGSVTRRGKLSLQRGKCPKRKKGAQANCGKRGDTKKKRIQREDKIPAVGNIKRSNKGGVKNSLKRRGGQVANRYHHERRSGANIDTGLNPPWLRVG